MANILPTENQPGSFDGRETKLVSCPPPCTCGRPTSVFTDDGEICPEQTRELRETLDYPVGTVGTLIRLEPGATMADFLAALHQSMENPQEVNASDLRSMGLGEIAAYGLGGEGGDDEE